MKLSVGDIRFSESGCASTNVGVEPGGLPFPICTMHVSVPLVEGKALEQYKDELLEKASDRIADMYKEIVCGGGQVLKPFKIEITSSPRDKLEERVANLELQIAEVKESTSCHMQLMQNNIQEIKSRTIQPHLSNRSC
ncbi:hypothetical protein F2D81_06525 [Salmonella enterica]|nr:hypothetical protein [Salmonella enterica]EBP3413057.1 hypothetical protein [Salmonella enterica subsp. diarizonae]EBP3905534.1 hypothetical protein [Salmonella enterica subsp. enterica]EAW8684009.1 hypothetical protein [Salmonella enterica]EAX5430254.1 hypothetical protein [Salmonella enterica]